MDKELYFAILLKDMNIEKLDMPVYMAIRPIIGYISKDHQIFEDVLSGLKYMSSEQAYGASLPEGYAFSKPLKSFKGKMFEKMPWTKLREEWNIYERNVYLYDEETCGIMTISIEDFEVRYNVKINKYFTEEINSFLDSLLLAEITNKEYYDTLYGISRVEKVRDWYVVQLEDRLGKISNVCSMIKRRVISQDEAIKKLVLSIYKRSEGIKSNILICGPTGCGKTELIRSLASIINVPVYDVDMTRFTEAGFVGANVDDIILGLIEKAGGDKVLAENSILFLDEIDKKATKMEKYSFNKGDVLKSLLKKIEGGVVEVKKGCGNIIRFDTSNLIVIAGGAFSSLYKESKTVNRVGFDREDERIKSFRASDIELEDLEKYGMPIEFLGRFGTIIKMNDLKIEDLVKILKESESNLLRKYEIIFERKGMTLDIPESVYLSIARKAYQLKTGARALNLIVEQIFDEILYEIFDSEESYESVVLGENIVDDEYNFSLKRGI